VRGANRRSNPVPTPCHCEPRRRWGEAISSISARSRHAAFAGRSRLRRRPPRSARGPRDDNQNATFERKAVSDSGRSTLRASAKFRSPPSGAQACPAPVAPGKSPHLVRNSSTAGVAARQSGQSCFAPGMEAASTAMPRRRNSATSSCAPFSHLSRDPVRT